jgi:Photosynthesis system II assembly factor YCF48/Putative zinc-finger
MESVPKIVVKRMQSPAAESHPDADLLTAFAEQSLTAAERDHVVEHLARCGDCREVVSLALLPQIESQPLAEHSVSWFPWTLLRGSALRWAAVAAGVVLIASVATMQYRRQQGRELASNVMEAKPAIATPAQSSEPASRAALPEAGAREDKLAPPRLQGDLSEHKPARSEGTIVLPRTNSAIASPGAIGGPVVRPGPSQVLNFAPARHGSVLGGTPAPSAAKQSPVPAAAPQTVVVGGAVPTLEAQSETVEVTAQSAPQTQIRGQFVQNETAEQSADRVGKAKPASAQASLAMAPPSLHSEPILMNGPAAPRWTISATGALQRSFDGGQTWQDVNVAANGSALDGRQKTQMMTLEVQADLTSEAQPETQPEAKKQAKSKDKQSAPVPAIFRALSVSSNATEVWAGGSGGALYHTTDAGNSWARVLPSAAGVNLTGDIVSVQFSDPRNGTVTTSTAEVWTTLDAGRSWHKQP